MNKLTKNKSLRSRLREESEAQAKFKRKIGKISLAIILFLFLSAATTTGILFAIGFFNVENTTTNDTFPQSINSTNKHQAEKLNPQKIVEKKKKGNKIRRISPKPKDLKQPLKKPMFKVPKSSLKTSLPLKTSKFELNLTILQTVVDPLKTASSNLTTNSSQEVKKPKTIMAKKSSNGPKGGTFWSTKKTKKISPKCKFDEKTKIFKTYFS